MQFVGRLVSVHDLRHTGCTRMLEAGMVLVVASSWDAARRQQCECLDATGTSDKAHNGTLLML